MAESPTAPAGNSAAAANPTTFTAITSTRTAADGVTNSTTSVTSATASFVAGDVGRIVTSADLPLGAYIQTVSNITTVLMDVAATGTHVAQSLVLTAEYVLWASNAAGLYSFHLDPSAMAAGDLVELRCYQMILTGGTRRVLDFVRLTDAQPTDGMIEVFDPIGSDLSDIGAVMYTLKQTAGTGRAFPFKALAY